jgi:hypothetical protein
MMYELFEMSYFAEQDHALAIRDSISVFFLQQHVSGLMHVFNTMQRIR